MRLKAHLPSLPTYHYPSCPVCPDPLCEFTGAAVKARLGGLNRNVLSGSLEDWKSKMEESVVLVLWKSVKEHLS